MVLLWYHLVLGLPWILYLLPLEYGVLLLAANIETILMSTKKCNVEMKKTQSADI